MKKFNMSAKSLYEVFSDYESDYVRVAAQSFYKENNTYKLIIKAYGPKFDGVERELITSYLEKERVNGVLLRIESHIKLVKVLKEVYKYSDKQILDLFYTKKDTEILAITRELLNKDNKSEEKLILSKELLLKRFNISESILSSALDYIDSTEKRAIYAYYYGIERPKLPVDKIIKMYPNYNEAKIKMLLLEIQKQIPELLMKLPEDKRKIDNKDISYASEPNVYSMTPEISSTVDFKYNNFFQYCCNDGDTIETKKEKRKIVLDYMNLTVSQSAKVVYKIFGPNYDSLNPDVELSISEKADFKEMCNLTKSYVDRIFDARHTRLREGRIRDTDRVFKASKRLKARLFDHLKTDKGKIDYQEKRFINCSLDEYFSKNHGSFTFVSEFYDMKTKRLYANSYFSKKDIKEILDIFNEIKEYINKRRNLREYPSKFIDYFVSNNTKEKTKNTINDLMLNYLNSVSSLGKQVAVKIWGENYDSINVDVDITNEDKTYLNTLINDIQTHIASKPKARERKSKQLESFFDYFISNRMKEETRNSVSKMINDFMSSLDHPGKNIVIKIYGDKYDTLNKDVILNSEEIILFNELIDLVKEFIQGGKKKELKGKGKTSIISDYFFDFLVTNNQTSDELLEDILLAKKYLGISNPKYAEVVRHVYGEDLGKIKNKDITDEEKQTLRLLRHDIRRYIDRAKNPGCVFKARGFMYNYFFDFLVADNQTIDELLENILLAKKFLESSKSKYIEVAKKVYGEDFGKIKNRDITDKERQKLRLLRIDIKRYIERTKNSESDFKPKWYIYDYFFDFLVTNDQTVDELHENILLAKKYLEKSKSKYVEIAKYVYGEELGRLKNKDITDEEGKNLRFLRHDIRRYIERIKNPDSISKPKRVINFKPNFIDYFDNIEWVSKDEIISRMIYNINVLKFSGAKAAISVYGENLDQFNENHDELSYNDKTTFCALIKYTRKRFKEPLFNFEYKEDFLSYFYDELDDRDTLIAKVNNYLGLIDNNYITIIRHCYDEKFMLKRTMKLTNRELKNLNIIIDLVKKLIKKDIDKANNLDEDKMPTTIPGGRIKLYFLDYFKLPNEEEISDARKDLVIKALNNSNSKYIIKLQDIYGENYLGRAKYTKVSNVERLGITSVIMRINRALEGELTREHFRLAPNFKNQFYLEGDTDDIKKEIDEIIFGFIASTRSTSVDIVNSYYDEDYNLKCNYDKLSNSQKLSYKTFIKSINKLVQEYRNGERKNNTKLKEYFLDYFITDDMSLEDKIKIPYIFELYRMRNRGDSLIYLSKVYDDNYHLRKNIKIDSEILDKIKYIIRYFKYAFLNTYLNKFVLPDNHNTKECDSTLSITKPEESINMMDLGNNSYLALKNDLFELEMVLKEEVIVESSYPDEVILNTYLEVNNSQTIMELLRISEDTLINFYLNNLETLEDISEALSFILHSNNKDVIKRLFVTPLFLNVVNDLSDQERQILYLKLVQVNDDTITDELISNITHVPVELIREYVIMTKEDKVNKLNQYIIKTHK